MPLLSVLINENNLYWLITSVNVVVWLSYYSFYIIINKKWVVLWQKYVPQDVSVSNGACVL